MEKFTKIGISSGELNGIGLQILIQSFDRVFKENKNILPIVFASKSSWQFYLNYLNSKNTTFNFINNIDLAKKGVINIFECIDPGLSIHPGKITKQSGIAAGQSLSAASSYLVSKQIDALVTMPVNKSNIFLEDSKIFIGHTEYLKEKSKAKETLMMLLSRELKVAMVTNHLPISMIAKKLDKNLLISKINILINSLKNDFLIDCPSIAVLGLNPHMGDSGLIGKEEIHIISPVVHSFSERRVNISGPFSADAFFGKKMYKNFDAVLSMYHDQGLIPFKMKSFNSGVNYTAGMNVIRTSPDHGPAYDIVGTNKVKHESFINAIILADKIYWSRLV